MKRFLSAIFFLTFCSTIYGVNSNSAAIYHEHLYNNVYKVTIKATSFCNGIPYGDRNLTVTDSNTYVILKMNKVSVKNVTYGRPLACTPGNNYGFAETIYESVFDLDTLTGGAFKSVCRLYFVMDYCCRNSSVTNSNAGNAWLESMIDRCNAPENHGPTVENLNIFWAQQDASVYFNPIVFDSVDNDILEYVPTPHKNSFNSYEVFASGFSPQIPLAPFCSGSSFTCTPNPYSNPIRGMFRDSLNGNMVFRMNTSTGIGFVSYRINEYRYINGQKKLIAYHTYEALYRSSSVYKSNNVELTKKTRKFSYNFKVGQTDTIWFETETKDTAKADSVMLECINPIKGAMAHLDTAWRSKGYIVWTPQCENAGPYPYLFFLRFYHQSSSGGNEVQSIAISIFVDRDLNIGNDTLICKNGTFNLKSNLLGQYEWNGQKSDSLRTFTANSAGSYTLKLSRGSCEMSDTIVLSEFNQLPNPKLGADTIVCDQAPNSSVTLSAGFEKDAKYRWSADTTFPYSYLYFKGEGPVTVKAQNICGFSYDTIMVTRLNKALVELGNDTSFCEMSQLEIKSKVIGVGSLKWSDGSTDSVLKASQAGSYYVACSNACGVSRDTINVNRIELPRLRVNSVLNLCNGASGFIYSNSNVYPLTWSTNETTDSIQVTAEGIYIARANNVCGMAIDTCRVRVSEFPKQNLDAIMSFCEPINYVLNATEYPHTQYKWNNVAGIKSYSITAAGKYILRAENFCGVSIDSTIVTELQKPSIDLGIDTAIKKPFTITLAVPNKGWQYLWSNAETDTSITINDYGVYWLRAENACGVTTDTLYVEEKVSIHQLSKLVNLVYPLPANDVLNVSIDTEVLKLICIDLTGRETECVYSCLDALIQIKVEGFTNGLYICQMLTHNGWVSFRFIVNH